MRPFRESIVILSLIISALLWAQNEKPRISGLNPDHSLATIPSGELPFEVETTKGVSFEPEMAARIYHATLEVVTHSINPDHPPAVLLRVTLRLGQPGYTLETVEGANRHTVINMQRWDQFEFARMMARAVRNGLLSDKELDRMAHMAVLRARSQISIREHSANK